MDVWQPNLLTDATLPTSFYTHRVLLLNADFRPFGFPLSTLTAQEAVSAMFLDRVVEVRVSNVIAHSPSMEMRLPSVVALKHYVYVPGMNEAPAFNRHNLYVRDKGICMYTGERVAFKHTDKQKMGTIDHVKPVSKGGATSWENCVLSSMHANLQKGSKLLHECGMNLIHSPWVPTANDLLCLWLTDERLKHMDEEWLEFLTITKSKRVEQFLERLALAA